MCVLAGTADCGRLACFLLTLGEIMFGRVKGATSVVSEGVENVSPYLDRLVTDEKLRRRLVAAVGAGLAARQRERKQLGLLGIAARLGTDPVLRVQLVEAVSQLQMAHARLQKSSVPARGACS